MNRIHSLLFASFLVFAITLPGCKSKPAPETAAAEAQPAADALKAESKPVENKPVETKPAETKPADPKPAEAKAEVLKQEPPKPESTKTAEVKPAPEKAAEAKPVDKKPEAKKEEPKKEEVKKEEPKPVVTFLNCDKAEALTTKKLDSGVIVEDLKLGEGSECKPGATVTINYHGTLKDGGAMFDTTRGKQPATFPLNRLIKGWQQGVPGMKPGGIRRLTIPYAQAYGENGRPPVIPAKADLVFVIELIGVVEPVK